MIGGKKMEKAEFQKQLMEQALKRGMEDCEVYYAGGKSFEVMIQEQEIAHFENSIQRGVSFRGIYQGRMGYAYTEWLEQEAIDYLIAEAIQNALIIEEEEKELLYGGSDSYAAVEGFNPSLEKISVEQKISDAKKMEYAAKNTGEEIKMVEYCLVGYGEGEISIANTKGLSVSTQDNFGTAYVSSIGVQKEEIKTGAEFWMGRDYSGFSPEKMGQASAKEAISHLGAQSVPSGQYAIVLKNLVAADLLSTFSGIFFGENAQKGFSLLAGKTGGKIAGEAVTLKDDGLYIGGMASVPFDSEGVASKNKTVIEKGILKTLLYNLKSAAKEGILSTGNGFKPSLQSPVQTACTNFYLEKGILSLDEILKEMGNGLYITEVAGLHSGANMVSGDFSLSAEGFFIEDGKRKQPVEQITIAGNFYEMLKDIVKTGNDLRFQMPGGNGCMGSPSVFIKKLAVAGV